MRSPYLTTAEVADYLRFVDLTTGALKLDAVRAYLKRHRVPTLRRGRAVLIRREDLDKSLEARRAS